MKVRSYIALLTAGGRGGAVFIALLGWFTFSGLKKSTSELQEESKKQGILPRNIRMLKRFYRPPEEFLLPLRFTPRVSLVFLMWLRKIWLWPKKV